MNRFWLLFLIFSVTSSGMGAEPVKVAAAADLNYALNELAKRF